MGEDSFINVWTTLAGVLIIFTLDWVWPPTPLCPLHKLGTAQCCSIKLALCSTQVTKERGTTIDWTTHKSTTKHKVSKKSDFKIQNWVVLQSFSWDSMRQGWNRVENPITHCVTLVLKSLFHVPLWNGWRARGFIFHMCGHFVLRVFAFHCSRSIHYTAHRSSQSQSKGSGENSLIFSTLSSSSLCAPLLFHFFSSESAKKREWRLRNKADLKMEREWIK